MTLVEQRSAYLTVDEAASVLRQSRGTVRRKIAAGQLAAVRLGETGPLRVPASAIDAHLRPAHPSIEGDTAA